MRLLLDAHTLIWAVDNPKKLGPAASSALQNSSNDLLLGAGSIWEIAIKFGLGKLSLSLPFNEWMNRTIADLGIVVLPITVDYAAQQSTLPQHHGDPFDRLLTAQAIIENVPVVSADPVFNKYGIERVW